MNDRTPYTFEVGKEYRTRTGIRARLYADDGHHNYPLHGAILRENGWVCEQWTRDGRWSAGSEVGCDDDLLPPEPEKVVRWLNVYEGYDDEHEFSPHVSRAEADKCALLGRLACIRIEYHEGQYDE